MALGLPKYDNSELIHGIEQYRQFGTMSEYLYQRLLFIARGVIAGTKLSRDRREDYEQECMVWFITNEHRLDLSGNFFCYLSNSFQNTCFALLREPKLHSLVVEVEASCTNRKRAKKPKAETTWTPRTRVERTNVTRSTVPKKIVTYKAGGIEDTLPKLAALHGIAYRKLHKRVTSEGLQPGEDVVHLCRKEALPKTGLPPALFVFRDEKKSLTEIAAVLRLKRDSAYARVRRSLGRAPVEGEDITDAVSTT